MPKAAATSPLAATSDVKQTATRQLRRQESNSKVTKILRDNFKGWDTAAVDLRLRGCPPISLRDRLTNGFRLFKANDPSAPVYGKKYYDTLKAEYRDEDDPLSQTEPDSDETVRPLLLTAMVATKKKAKDFTLMMAELAKMMIIASRRGLASSRGLTP